ncbi:hypothetical protein HQ531_03360 [bacterium]|nr:hypothetical protein [bacterium]
MRANKFIILSILCSLWLVSCKSKEVNEVIFQSHKLDFMINVEKQHAIFTDKGLFQVFQGANVLYLTPGAEISELLVDGKQQNFMVLDSNGIGGLDPDLGAKIDVLDPPKDALTIIFDQNTAKKATFSLSYAANFKADVTEVKFSNQNVGREVTGTILEKGAYFSPSAYYYPRANDGLMDFEVSVTIPAHWESIAGGNSIGNIQTGDTKIQTWKNPFQSDGLMFMAAPFVVKHAKADDVDVYCYFFEEDTSLFETYLPATVEYVKTYSEMIGPYPYTRFTVAENFFPTGYGMPAWTLLGQQVIRLPFIVMTSLGHEVLHNWWGNSIYVDYSKGNWCEGLTVYGADYHYKLARGAASARDYRKDILKQYKSYVTAENEFPVREFVARHNAESRTIGYNKTMMIFHMIEVIIGTEAFFQAWRDIYSAHAGEQVSWEQWVTAYEQSSGEDLGFIIPEWVDRVGAARIEVKLLESDKTEAKTTVKFRVSQSAETLYKLKIPIRFTGINDQDVEIGLTAAEATYEFELDGDFEAFELDPDYHLFRHLYPEEIEPTVAAVMGAQEKHFLFYIETEKEALKSFGDNLTEGDVTPIGNTTVNIALEGNYSLFTLNPTRLPAGLAKQISINESSISINGSEFPREGHTFVLSAEDQEIAAKILVIISQDLESLPRIGQLVPHYGKYSYLVFKGTRNIAKGQWPALTSPLRVEL